MIKRAIISMHTISGQFLLLIGLMLIYFTTSISVDMYRGDLQAASDLAAASYRDIFMIAVGLFRAMKSSSEEDKGGS